MIYGASTAETEKALRSYVLGFVEIEAKPIRDSDKASELGMQIKRDKGWADRWTYGIPVKRAWRTEEKLMISRIASIRIVPRLDNLLLFVGPNWTMRKSPKR